MPLTIPSRSDVATQGEAYVRTDAPELDPSVSRRSYVGGMVKAFSLAVHDFYVALRKATKEFFPQTATVEFLTTGWWVDITGLVRNSESPAQGRVTITGTAGLSLASGAVLTANSISYTANSAIGIAAQSISITSLTRSGTVATAETSASHFLATGMTVTISGATEGDYNGSYSITVTADNEFTYTVANSPSTPATGTPIATATYGVGSITSGTNGTSGNLSSGSTLSISTPPTGVDSTARVTFGEIAGGANQETVEAYRDRVLEALGTDYGMFTASEIKIVAKEITGVTRVWVKEATLGGTNGVDEGQVEIAFVRDNDSNIFPSSSEVQTVKDHIVTSIKPAHTATSDVIVQAPVANSVDITFSALAPDTVTMRAAITARLEQFFAEAVEYETDIPLLDIECAIKDAYSTEDKAAPTSFTLSAPAGATSISTNELPRLGTVTFP